MIIVVPCPIKVRIGALGETKFLEGYYVYVGSAQGQSMNLENRLSRHFSKEKKVHWHIDYLLDADVEILDAVFSESAEPVECLVAKRLASRDEADWGPIRFGASDCESGCRSHLIHFGLDSDIKKIVGETFKDMGLNPSLYTHVLHKPSS